MTEKELTQEKKAYITPHMEAIDVAYQGMLCQSNNDPDDGSVDIE